MQLVHWFGLTCCAFCAVIAAVNKNYHSVAGWLTAVALNIGALAR